MLTSLFIYYGTPRKFKCSLISKTDLRVASNNKSNKTVNNKHNKRLLSTAIEAQGSKSCIKKRNKKIDDDIDSHDDDDLNLFNQTQNQHQSLSRNAKILTISISNTPTDLKEKENTELPKELTLSELNK